jgi:hypothetical protein
VTSKLMSKMICVALVVLPSIVVRAQQNKTGQAGVPPAPPEVKQAVDALTGTWAGQMTAKVPGYAPETFDWLMECKPVALRSAVACTNEGKASIGQLSESCLFAFDSEGRAVHYMCVTSMGEVHDHKGQWKDSRTIEFEPLRAGMMGGQVIETMRWQFVDANTLDKISTMTMSDGSAAVFEFKAKRK